jgi:hypothetical protein
MFSACQSVDKDNAEKYSSAKPEILIEPAYPAVIDSLNIRDLYDSARWLTYCINCDDTCFFHKQDHVKDTLVTFGELKIVNYDTKLYNNDTIDISFKFLMDTIRAYPSDANSRASLGAQYKISTKNLLTTIEYTTLKYRLLFGMPKIKKNRAFFPLQPEVVKYINNNKDKLNPWFHDEAKRRGVIKE